jgi:putative transposase
MSKNSAVAFPPPQAASADPLTEVLRQGAKRLLAQAIEAEVETLLACYADVRDEQGRQAVVRNGYLPKREVQTGIGAVSVHVPRVRDRSGQGIRFHSSILPPYMRRSRSVEEWLPWL